MIVCLNTEQLDNPVKKLFHIAGFDEKSQELAVKVVNASSQPLFVADWFEWWGV